MHGFIDRFLNFFCLIKKIIKKEPIRVHQVLVGSENSLKTTQDSTIIEKEEDARPTDF